MKIRCQVRKYATHMRVAGFALCLSLMLLINGPSQAKDHGKFVYKTSKEIYEKCKSALESDSFEDSFCAAYLEGYAGGGSVMYLYALSLADNQKEIIEGYHKNQCSKLGKDIKGGDGVKWLARFFVGWIDSNQNIVSRDRAFLEREASVVLHTITTDPRFCLNKTIGD